MKTAISIDDQIFKSAEKTAKKLGISRSKLFTVAITEYLDQHNVQDITNKLNEVYSENNNKLNSEIETAQISSVNFGEW